MFCYNFCLQLSNILQKYLLNIHRWFHISKKELSIDTLDKIISEDVCSSAWIDGLQHQVFLHIGAINEVMDYLNSQSIEFDEGVNEMYSLFFTIQELYSNQDNLSVDDSREWYLLKSFFLFDDPRRHLPVPVYSFVRSTMDHRFILHILLSLGHYSTEFDLVLHSNLRESFRYAKLIGPNNDPESLEKYSSNLLKLWINEQLVYFPNSSRILD